MKSLRISGRYHLDKPLRIGLLSVDEPCFVRPMWQDVVAAFSGQVALVVEVPYRSKYISRLSQFALSWVIYRWRVPCLLLAAIAAGLRRRLGSISWLNKLADSTGAEYRYVDRFDSQEMANLVREKKLDVLLCQVPYIVRTELLDAPTYGCWNKHFGKLPEHRGSATFLFTLATNDRHLYYTVYIMGKTLDCGWLLEAGQVGYNEDRSLFRNLQELNKSASRAVIEALLKAQSGQNLHTTDLRDIYPDYRLPGALGLLRLGRRARRGIR